MLALPLFLPRYAVCVSQGLLCTSQHGYVCTPACCSSCSSVLRSVSNMFKLLLLTAVRTLTPNPSSCTPFARLGHTQQKKCVCYDVL
jgi:hypothetical protein